jgi:uncharacterized membrane protein YdjX (TVP38/TMEM64 family)
VKKPEDDKLSTAELDALPDNVRGRMIAIGIYVALSIGLYFVLAPAISNQEELTNHLQAAGVWGVLSYIGLYTAQMFIPWLPGAPLDIIGGATFGFWETVLLSSISASGSGLIILLVVRRIGLEKIVARFPGLLESPWRLIKIIRRQPWALIAVNMLTGDVAYFVAGAARTPLIFTMILLGAMRIPSVMVGCALGAGIISNVIQNRLNTFITIATFGTIATLLIGFAIARKYLPGWLERLEAASNNSSSSSDSSADR